LVIFDLLSWVARVPVRARARHTPGCAARRAGRPEPRGWRARVAPAPLAGSGQGVDTPGRVLIVCPFDDDRRSERRRRRGVRSGPVDRVACHAGGGGSSAARPLGWWWGGLSEYDRLGRTRAPSFRHAVFRPAGS